VTALDIELQVQRGQLTLNLAATVGERPLAIVGPNGAGKTTTLLALAGIVRPRAGHIRVGAEVLFDAGAGVDLPPESRGLAYVPPDSALFPPLTARQNVEFALRCLPAAASGPARRAEARTWLDRVGALATEDRRPAALSGGERQRVALARALATAPRALLFDEPFAALDASTRGDLRRYLAERLAQLGLPALVVTHDADDARRLGQRLAVLERGRLTQTGSWAELAAQPATPFVRAFVASARK
jgi:molybdate transport system ATP-binding protein